MQTAGPETGDRVTVAESMLGQELWDKLSDLEESTAGLEGGKRFTEITENLPSYEDVNKGETSHLYLHVEAEKAAENDALLISVTALQDDNQTPTENAETCRIFLRKSDVAGVARSKLELEVAGPERFDAKWESSQGYTRDGERFVTLPLDGADAQGDYFVAVEHTGKHHAQMSVKVAYSFVRVQDAIDVGPDTTTRGENGASEFTFYRFVNTTPEALVTIHARPVMDETGEPIGDPDLYVSNIAEGMAPVDRDRYVWKSCNVGADRVDIHPGDSSALISNTYLIGILGYKEHNVFEVEIKVTPPLPITRLHLNSAVDFEAGTNTYQYFKLKVDPERRSQIRLKLYCAEDPDGRNGANDDGHEPEFMAAEEGDEQDLVQTFGRGIYTMDLSSFHLNEDQLELTQNGFRPIMYVSCCVMYPTADDTTMRAIAPEGPAVALLECDEWKYNGEWCYIGVRLQNWLHVEGYSEDEAKAPDASRPCRIVVSEREEIRSLPRRLRGPFQVWNDLFGDIDGGSVSQKDRTDLETHSDSSFTYGEVEFVSFSKLLAACNVQPGETFCDLGSGTGKAVFIAAFGGHGFGRCVGIELLPNLHRTAVETQARILGEDGQKARSLLQVDLPAIDFVEGDITTADWSDADIVYTSSICFTDELIVKVGVCARKLKPGARFCTLKVWPGAEEHFDTVYTGWFKMSWGRICVYVLQRR